MLIPIEHETTRGTCALSVSPQLSRAGWVSPAPYRPGSALLSSRWTYYRDHPPLDDVDLRRITDARMRTISVGWLPECGSVVCCACCPGRQSARAHVGVGHAHQHA